MKNVTLHAWPGITGLPTSSPFCYKVLTALKYKRVPHLLKIAKMGPPKWVSRGMLPAAEIGDRKVEDSTRILRAVDEAFPESPRLYPEDPHLRAETILLEDWADEWLEHFVPYYRWSIDHHWAPFSAEAFAAMPGIARALVLPMIRRGFVQELRDRGIGRDTEVERVSRFKEAVFLVEQKLSRHRFLVCDTPTAADFAVYPTFRMLRVSRIHELLPHFDNSPELNDWLQAMENAIERQE